MVDIDLEKKLEPLRKMWRETKDPKAKKLIEARAKLLKMGQAKSENIYEKAKKIFK